jgi:extradiol dioxygenase family protein
MKLNSFAPSISIMLHLFSSAIPIGVSGFRATAASATRPRAVVTARLFSSTIVAPSNTTSASTSTQYETRSSPAPGNPFHYAFPVHSLEEAKKFYGSVLGCEEGRSSDKWQDYSLYGHQIVCHWAGDDYRCIDYYNPVDGDEVPVPHAGLALETVEQFEDLVKKLRSNGIQFVIEPHLRFVGEPGEQYTMFFKDPSGNNLEFKAMTNHANLFAKYNVPADE